MTSPSASWSYQPSPYYYKVISVNSVHRFFRFSGEVKRLCHVSVLVRQVPKPASPYFAVFHKGVGGGKYRAGALFLLTGTASNFAALYLVSSDWCVLKMDLLSGFLLNNFIQMEFRWQQQRRRFRISIQLLLRAAQFNPDRTEDSSDVIVPTQR